MSTHKYNKYFTSELASQKLKKKAVEGAGVTVFSRVLNYGISLFGTLALARLLTPDDFGLVTMVSAFSLLISNFGINGFPEAIIQKKELNQELVTSIFWMHTGISFILVLGFIGLAPLIVWFYDEPRLYPIIYVMAFSIAIPSFYSNHMGLLKRNMEYFKFASVEVVAAVVSSVLGVALALLGCGLWAIVARRMAVPLVTAFGTWILCDWRPGLPTISKDFWPAFRYALSTFGNFLTYYLSKNIDKILLGKFYGSQNLANYDRAYHLFAMPLNQLTTPLTNIALPVLSRLQDQPDKYLQYFFKAFSIISFVGMPLSAVLTICGSDLILILLGPQWTEAGKIFSILGLSIGVTLLYGTHGWLHLSIGRADRFFKWGIVSVLLTVACFIIGLRYGSLGVATGYSASFYLLLIPGIWYAGKPMNLKIGTLIAIAGRYFFAALFAGGVCWYLFNTTNFSSDFYLSLNVISRIFVSSILCLSIYTFVLICLYRGLSPIRDFISILSEMLPDPLVKRIAPLKKLFGKH